LASCYRIKRTDIDYIVYGTYAGECYGNCSIMYKLENTRLLVDTTGSFFKNNSKEVTFGNHVLSNDDFLKAQAIRKEIPDMLLLSNSKEFGSPDHHDQGGIFIALKSGYIIKKFYIDTDLRQIPLELRDYAKLIEKLTGY